MSAKAEFAPEYPGAGPGWKSRLVRLALNLTLAAVLFYLITGALIDFCVSDLKTPSATCLVFIGSGGESQFLIWMGPRAAPAIRRELDDARVPIKQRIHLAWILSKIGDHSRFQTFLEGLASDKIHTQAIAASRMRDFPDECLRRLTEILAAPRAQIHDSYRTMIASLARTAGLDDERESRLMEILYFDRKSEAPFSPAEQQEIFTLFDRKR